MRALVRASAAARGSARRVAYHRLALSQLSSSSSLPARVYHRYFAGTNTFSSSARKLSTNMDSQTTRNLDGLRGHLTHNKLEELRAFWFEHLTSETDRAIPRAEQQRRWFFGGKEFDDICVPILEAIKAAGITSIEDILAVAQPRDPLDWLSLVILLDQIPRNSYRGTEAAICFTFFDPLAVQLTLKALEEGLPDKAPELRWQFSHRNWLYMPLMHSEDASAHEKALLGYERMQQDILSLLEGTGGENEYEKKARETAQADPETAKAFGKLNVDFEKKHQVIIERFGRYPHRNKALGREPTAEETEYLENGGDTFAA
ncbi:hypothetical protein CDV36_001407 [Fusarium kuroshium]|uniref:Uncharacterized protein n=2 Tax=Fusarium solani species complex TaxID=232080 RepID=A0A3M2SN51_9HYPO|nr:hypothetical protein CDV36_001407 [Fusarium kuroshium]RSM13111.1 hypothetical protein CEP52_002095 [Fusarium oligoseptatum]